MLQKIWDYILIFITPLVLLAVGVFGLVAYRQSSGVDFPNSHDGVLLASDDYLANSNRLAEPTIQYFLSQNSQLKGIEEISYQKYLALRNELAKASQALPPSSCLVVKQGDVNLYSHNAQIGLVPASGQKLLLALSALIVLGPDYTYTTQVRAVNEPVNGRLAGNLFLVGGGDPFLWTDDYFEFQMGDQEEIKYSSLNELANQLIDAGLFSISGAVVGVENRYDEARYPPAWPIGFRNSNISGPLSALIANQGFELQVVEPEEPEEITPEGNNESDNVIENDDVENTVENDGVNDDAENIAENAVENDGVENDGVNDGANNVIENDGVNDGADNVIENTAENDDTEIVEPEREWGPAFNSAISAATIFDDLLEAKSVRIPFSPFTSTNFPSIVLAEIESPPLSDLLKNLLSTSDNTAAELVLKEMGFKSKGVGSTQAGIEAMVDALVEAGIYSTRPSVLPSDGSGVSQSTRTTCMELMKVLEYSNQNVINPNNRENSEPNFNQNPLIEKLSIPSKRGTLLNFSPTEEVNGRVSAKTGTWEGVASLTGFVSATPIDSSTRILGNKNLLRFSYISNDTLSTSLSKSQRQILEENIVSAMLRYLE